MEKISLRFQGGTASIGRLHFYEYSRSQYATARFISTLEHFRRSGQVSQKITGQSYVNIFVEAPQEGSFLETILIQSQETAASAISAHLSRLISLVWNTLLQRPDTTENELLEMARIQLAEEEQRTQQAREQTFQMNELRQIVDSQNATTQQALSLVDQALNSSNRAYDRAEIDRGRMLALQRELERERARQQRIELDRSELENIDADKLAKLTSRVRPMVPEMALPLRRSADKISVEAGEESEPIAELNRVNVAAVVDRELSDEVVEMDVRVRSYDRDRGVGKISAENLPRQLNFLVAPNSQLPLLDKILNAMRRDFVKFHCRKYLDKSGQVTALLLEDVILS